MGKQTFARIAEAHYSKRASGICEGPPQTQSPAMISQGLTNAPLVVASCCHVTVTYPACHYRLQGRAVASFWIGIPSINDFTLRLTIPTGVHVALIHVLTN